MTEEPLALVLLYGEIAENQNPDDVTADPIQVFTSKAKFVGAYLEAWEQNADSDWDWDDYKKHTVSVDELVDLAIAERARFKAGMFQAVFQPVDTNIKIGIGVVPYGG